MIRTEIFTLHPLETTIIYLNGISQSEVLQILPLKKEFTMADFYSPHNTQ